jgi:hypothetical protein
MGFSADCRAAAVSFLTDYKASQSGLKLQIYPARPRSLMPPTAFVDSMRDTITLTGIELHQRRPTVDVIVVHGLFDSLEAVTQRDAFVDGLIAWIIPRYHEAGANTLIAPTEIEDIPAFVNDWMPPSEQKTFFATRISLEGFAQN